MVVRVVSALFVVLCAGVFAVGPQQQPASSSNANGRVLSSESTQSWLNPRPAASPQSASRPSFSDALQAPSEQSNPLTDDEHAHLMRVGPLGLEHAGAAPQAESSEPLESTAPAWDLDALAPTYSNNPGTTAQTPLPVNSDTDPNPYPHAHPSLGVRPDSLDLSSVPLPYNTDGGTTFTPLTPPGTGLRSPSLLHNCLWLNPDPRSVGRFQMTDGGPGHFSDDASLPMDFYSTFPTARRHDTDSDAGSSVHRLEPRSPIIDQRSAVVNQAVTPLFSQRQRRNEEEPKDDFTSQFFVQSNESDCSNPPATSYPHSSARPPLPARGQSEQAVLSSSGRTPPGPATFASLGSPYYGIPQLTQSVASSSSSSHTAQIAQSSPPPQHASSAPQTPWYGGLPTPIAAAPVRMCLDPDNTNTPDPPALTLSSSTPPSVSAFRSALFQEPQSDSPTRSVSGPSGASSTSFPAASSSNMFSHTHFPASAPVNQTDPATWLGWLGSGLPLSGFVSGPSSGPSNLGAAPSVDGYLLPTHTRSATAPSSSPAQREAPKCPHCITRSSSAPCPSIHCPSNAANNRPAHGPAAAPYVHGSLPVITIASLQAPKPPPASARGKRRSQSDVPATQAQSCSSYDHEPRAAKAKPRSRADPIARRTASTIPDLRGGIDDPELPRGFYYRSFQPQFGPMVPHGIQSKSRNEVSNRVVFKSYEEKGPRLIVSDPVVAAAQRAGARFFAVFRPPNDQNRAIWAPVDTSLEQTNADTIRISLPGRVGKHLVCRSRQCQPPSVDFWLLTIVVEAVDGTLVHYFEFPMQPRKYHKGAKSAPAS